MKLSVVLPFALAGCATAFAPAAVQQRPAFVVRMSEEEVAVEAPVEPAAPAEPAAGGSLVPIKEETVEFTAGLLGGAIGFAVGGPVLGAIGATIANYASKTDSEVSSVITAVSKSSIQIFNYLTYLDDKYTVLNKAQDSLQDTLSKIKTSQSSVDPEVIEKVESALSNTKDKIEEVNNEYDLVGNGVTALGVVGELVEKAIVKAGELNEEYKLTDKAKDTLGKAVDKAKEAAGSS